MEGSLINYPTGTHESTVPAGTVLLTLSGGIDSTYALWRLLSDGHKVVVLHVDLRNWEGRALRERGAVRQVLEWLTDHGLTEWEYVEVCHDYGTLMNTVRDIELIRFHAGVTLRQRRYRGIDTVVASGILEDPDLPDEDVARIRQILEATAARPVRLWRPIRRMPKAQIIADMPEGLLRAAWYCRRPRGRVTCGRCRTCGHVADAAASPWTGPRGVLDPPEPWGVEVAASEGCAH